MIQDQDRRFARDPGDFAVNENIRDEVAEHDDALPFEAIDDGSEGGHRRCE
jgi:hypothetical protein